MEGCSEHFVASEEEVHELMEQGFENRTIASTLMNKKSSRSHCIVIFRVQQRDTETQTVKTGVLNLVDLAGSEKVGKAGSQGLTLTEAN